MAKNKVKIDVTVDDKGTTKKVGVGAKNAADNLDKAGKSAHNTDRQLKGAAQASSNTTKNFSKMSQGISGGLVPAYATLAAQLFAVSAAFNFLKRSGDIVTFTKRPRSFCSYNRYCNEKFSKRYYCSYGGSDRISRSLSSSCDWYSFWVITRATYKIRYCRKAKLQQFLVEMLLMHLIV